MDTRLEELNEVQRDAVTATHGPVLVLAGAGSGKTRVLTHKVAYLVRELGVPPSSILAFTFTNKAAEEMRERIERLLDGRPRGVWTGTFHATAVRILRAYAGAAGLDRGFSIFDRDDSVRVVRAQVKDAHLSEDELRPRAVLERISAAKSAGLTPGDVSERAASRREELVALLYARYEEELRRQSALDFDDLLLRALALLENDAAVRERLSDRFRHVLVDEYQDTNAVQFALIRALASKHRNLTVVGDDDQSIYGWRGADIRNILDFEEHYPEAKVLRLEQNYRSTKRILAAANAVVVNNAGRKAKELWTENEEGEKIGLVLAPDEEREAETVLDRVSKLTAAGTSLSDIAVLYRTNAQSRPFEEVCLRRRVRYRIVGGVQFFARQEIKDALAYLKLAVNPGDEVSFVRAISAPKRGVGKVSLTRLVEYARGAGISILDAALGAGSIPGLSPKAATELRRFGLLIDRIRLLDEEEPADRVLALVLDESGLSDTLLDGGPDGTARRENLDELIAGARSHAARSETPGFRAYVEDVALRTDLDAWHPGEEAVTLMTVHNAKGLEFEIVFIAGLEEGLFPHSSSLDDPEGLEEERRLFYVALTRARRRLFLSASRDRRRMNRFEAARPSRFVEEVPDDLVTESDPYGLGLRSGRFSSRSLVRRRAGSRAPGSIGIDDGAVFELDGDRRTPEFLGRIVWHAKYGRGVVLVQDGHGESAKCQVRFAGETTRKIVARFLNVEEDDGAS